jgi:hypothetical protein
VTEIGVPYQSSSSNQHGLKIVQVLAGFQVEQPHVDRVANPAAGGSTAESQALERVRHTRT